MGPSAARRLRNAAFGRSRVTYLIAILLGIGLALWLVPPDVILARGPLTGATAGDVAQHIVGRRYFIADAWRWPPLMVRALGWPEGTNIAFTDSIPLVAGELLVYAPPELSAPLAMPDAVRGNQNVELHALTWGRVPIHEGWGFG